MKYRVSIDGQEREVDVVLGPDGATSVSVDGQPTDADIVRMPDGISVRIGDHVFDVAVGGRPDSATIAAGARRTVVSVESDRARARRRGHGGRDGERRDVRAPMPGRVVKVLVATGDDVEAGQPVVVVEAMKMENELRATAPGRVKSVEVAEGQNVESHAVLVRFD